MPTNRHALNEKIFQINQVRRNHYGKSLVEYVQTAFAWRYSSFPYQKWFDAYLLQKTARMYGAEVAQIVQQQLQNHRVVETGAHFGFLKSRDRVTNEPSDTEENTFVFQGLLTSIALQSYFSRRYHISFSCDWTPLSTTYGASYFEAGYGNFIRCFSNKFSATPHYKLPPIDPNILCKLPFTIDRSIAPIEQLALIASQQMNSVLKYCSIKHLVFDLFDLVKNLFIHVLSDPLSFTYRIFSSPPLFQCFHKQLIGLPTSWGNDEFVMSRLVAKNGGVSVEKIYHTLSVEEMLEGLRNDQLLLKTPLVFFLLIVEAGILPIGGMNQIRYCSGIQETAVAMLRQLGQDTRAMHLQQMPLAFSIYDLIWGIQKNDPFPLTHYGHVLNGEFAVEDAYLQEMVVSKKYEDLLLAGYLATHGFFNQSLTNEEIRDIKIDLLDRGF